MLPSGTGCRNTKKSRKRDATKHLHYNNIQDGIQRIAYATMVAYPLRIFEQKKKEV